MPSCGSIESMFNLGEDPKVGPEHYKSNLAGDWAKGSTWGVPGIVDTACYPHKYRIKMLWTPATQ